MSRPGDTALEEFFTQMYQKLVMSSVRAGASLSDAEDATQAVFMRTLERWTNVQNPHAYFRQAVSNELAAIVKRQHGDLARTVGWASQRVELSAADVYHRGEADIVRDCLTILSRRQRELVAYLYEGYRPHEIADTLGVLPSTVRSNRRHAHQTLTPFVTGDEHELRRWMRSGERVYEAFHRGETLPLAPRKVIGWAWKLAKDLQVDPKRSTEVATLSQDEVIRRRRESPVAACSWVLNAMVDLAEATEHMMVITDADSTVLWRGGARKIQDAADVLGFVQGANWDLAHAGVNGISLASIIGTTVAVSRWEHYCSSQHGLSCVAAPVRDPHDGRVWCVLNLTGTQPAVHHAIRCQVDTIALRLHQQLRTLWTHRHP
jgi:RNA polymerase sigma factor (sigma-70 family)